MKVYITRDLKQDSPLLLQLQAAGYLVFGQSLIQIRALPVKELPHTDWLFFYSKNGVTALLDQLTDLSVLQAYQMAAFGSATAQLLQERGVDLDFVGNGKPDQVPAEFQKIVHTQTVCFIQGTSSRATVQKAIGAAIDFEECIVYQNTPASLTELPAHDVAIFTSPMNVESYFQIHAFDPRVQYIAIGTTTQKAAQAFVTSPVLIPESPSESALATLVLQLK